ncbi:MAG TPA: hypothetical protein DCY55_05980 [Gammaproteobacteria bacterium]|nr:hypothetical protein [Gammaproteobacteria bacterium]
MASPVAHSLAGVSILALFFPDRLRYLPIIILSVFTATLPDFDLIVPGIGHRTVMHSITFSVVISMSLFIWLKIKDSPLYLVIPSLFFLGIGSHIIIDWVSLDLSEPAGLVIGWPWNMNYQISDNPIFLNVHRNDFFEPTVIAHNVKALLQESIIMFPVTLLILFWRRSYFRTGFRCS